MIDNIRITLRQKLWWMNFGMFLFFFLASGYLAIDVFLNKNNPNSIVVMVVFALVLVAFFFLMASYTVKVTVFEKKIEVEKLFIFKRNYLIEDIDRVKRVDITENGTRYTGIEIYIKGKRIWIFRTISEMWNNYDELILFLKEKNIPMERE